MKQHTHQATYRPDIDGLRALAVLSVVTFHAFPQWMKGGFVGVDIFFVISGYLISNILFQSFALGTFSYRDFYKRRIRRIFPALAIVLSATYIFGWFALLPGELEQLAKHIVAGAAFVSNLLLWSEVDYFDVAAETKPLLHLWSLGIEEQFYILWPPLIWLTWRLRRSPLVMTLVVIGASFAANIALINGHSAAAFYSPLSRVWELAAGGILACISLRPSSPFAFFRDERQLCNASAIAGSGLIAISMLTLNKDSSFPGFWAALPVAGAFLLILAGPRSFVNKHILSNPVLVWFGLISYPLYLWHWPILSYMRIMEGETPSRDLRIVAVAASIILAWLTYKLIEQPIRRGGRLTVVLPSTAILSIAVIAGLTVASSGIPWRENIREHQQLTSRFELSKDDRAKAPAPIMLIGDSHAAHLAPGLREKFGERLANFSSSGCIPLDGVDRYDYRSTPGSCLKVMKKALSLAESEEVETVVLASMGPVYLTGEAFGGFDLERVRGLGVTLDAEPTLTNRWEIFEIALRNTLSRLVEKGKKVVFVIDVPELGFDPRTCFNSRPLTINSDPRSPCAVSRSDYEERAARYVGLVKEVAANFSSVTVYDPTEDFCDAQWCWAIKDGRILYRDGDHLSDEGSIFLANRISSLIERSTPLLAGDAPGFH